MYALIALLARYGGIIAFIVLEFFSIYLAVRYNKNQREIYINSANTISGAIYQRYSKAMRFAELSVVADSMAAENARLYARLGNAKFNDYLVRDSAFVKDSLSKIKQQYTYISANVISNSIALPNNYIVINRGSRHGVKAGMGVITPKGVIGIVRNVSPNFSQIMSILHQQSRISAAIKNKGHFGTLRWRDPSSILNMSLETLPKHSEIKQGDSIQTSGYSFIFPEGIPIGAVERFQIEPGSNYYTAQIKLFEDLGKLRYVYVVDNLMAEEQKQLIEETLQQQ